MKRWRIAQCHPEDRYEPDDEVADAMRSQLQLIESKIKDASGESLNRLFLELRNLRVDLAERLYGK